MAHQHVTGKNRPKRVDTRPDTKSRLKLLKTKEAALTAKELRVTRTSSKEKREREIPTATEAIEKTKLSKDEVLVRCLKKKLRGIDALITKQKEGATLDEKQLVKIGRLDDLMKQLEVALAKCANSTASNQSDDNIKDGDESVDGE